MNPRPLRCLASVLALLSCEAAAQVSADNLDAELEALRSQYGLPGLSAMVVKGGRILARGAAGSQRYGVAAPLTPDDPVNIGSCTKWMTATLAGRLVDRGVITWGTRIRDVFPDPARFNAAYLDVTLAELLAHRGGVPDGLAWAQRFQSALNTQTGSVAQIRRWVAEVTLADRPQVARGAELYSNQGYTIAAVVLELRTGRSWEELMTEEVFLPLGMTSARIGASHDDPRGSISGVSGHDLAAAGAGPVPRAAMTAAEFARYQAANGPAGLVVCTLRDWALFLHRHARGGEGYLEPATAATLRTPFAGTEGYALGVGVFNRAWAAPGPALNHTGDILGQSSLFWLAPAPGLIVLTYTNTAARDPASGEARNAAAGRLVSRYWNADPRGPNLDGRPLAGPVFTRQPDAVTVQPGEAATFSASAEGTGTLSYQWKFNDTPIPGASGPSWTIARVSPADTGYYSVDVRNADGTTSSRAATLTLAAPGPAARLGNLSILARLAPRETLTAGFTIQGGPQPVLLRAAGPALGALGVAEPLPDPMLTVHGAGQRVAANDDWPAGAALSAATAAAGAFAWPPGSPDAAILQTLAGSHTLEVQGSPRSSGSSPNEGMVLLEVYDAGGAGPSRLANLSVLHVIDSARAPLTIGFAVVGAEPKRLLIRAIGPGLGALGVAEFLGDPRFALFDSDGVRRQQNDDWNPSLAATFAAAGAFPLPAGSRDAALVVSLPPGNHTVEVGGRDNQRGLALVELYELP